jgi:cytochrome c oxidase assembly protein subunit 11
MSAPGGIAGGSALPRRGRGRMVVSGVLLALVALTMMYLAIYKFPELYGMFCRALGVAQNPNGARAVAAPSQHSGRFIDVIFEGVAMDKLPVHFYPDKTEVRLEVGTDAGNTYHFKNVSDHAVSFRPVHQISPVAAARPEVFGLKVCFCFANQTIPAGETRDFPVVFTFTPALDERINTVTVRYSLFEIAADAPLTDAQKAIQESLLPPGAIVSPGAVTKPSPAPHAAGGAP